MPRTGQPHEADHWGRAAEEIIRNAAQRNSVTFAEIRRRLAKHGLELSSSSFTQRLQGGRFSAAFLLLVMHVLNEQSIPVPKGPAR